MSYGQAFHINDPRIGKSEILGGTIVSKARSYQLVVSKTVAQTELRVTLAHVTTAQQLARISNDTGLQQDAGPGLVKSMTATVRHNFTHGFLQGLFARADARDRLTGLPTPEAPRLIWGVLGTVDKLPFHSGCSWRVRARGHQTLRLGDGFNSVPAREFRGAVIRPFASKGFRRGRQLFWIPSAILRDRVLYLALPAAQRNLNRGTLKARGEDMRRMQLNRIGCVVVCLLAALPALADTRFQIRRMIRDDVPRGKGQCDVRLQVDDQVEVSVQGDGVFIRTLSGQDARDDGSECNAPLPPRDVRGFNFEVKDSRGDIKLVEEPSDRNGGRAVVRIRDSAGGFGRYHFRLSWDLFAGDRQGGGDRPQERRDNDRAGDLRVVSGFWGAPGRGREVTRLLQDRVREGRLRIRATDEALGFDPGRGQEKMLIVNFEFRGRRQEVRVREGEFLELP